MDPNFWKPLLIIIVIFLIFREIVCWYWKQNEIVSILKDIRHAVELQAGIETKENKKTKSKPAGEAQCWNCGKKYPTSVTKCPDCGHNKMP
jgi:hypothetical protein